MPRALLFWGGLLASLHLTSAAPIDSFLPPQLDAFASGGDLGPSSGVASIAECAASCLASSECISFNVAPPLPTTTCGIREECYAPNASSCPSVLSFNCVGGTFTGVSFASFGTPLISSPPCGFTKGKCDAPSSVDVVTAACVGKSSCDVDVSVSTFGPDPCSGVVKFAAISLIGTGCSSAPPPAGSLQCTLSGHSRVYTVDARPGSSYFQRLQPRNDTPITQAVPYALDVPTGGVTLHPGLLRDAFDINALYLLGFEVDDLLFDFRRRANVSQAPGAKCVGWDCRVDWIEGSLAGLYLMGAGGHLRWEEHAQLRAAMDKLIDGIANCTEPDGYLAAFTQAKLATDEHPDYTTSWTVHGFLEAHAAGNAKALRMIRAHMNVFNNHTLLPTFLPPDGGNWPWQVPAGPWPGGVNNVSQFTGSTLTGHTIYLIVQGLIHSTRMALSPAGTQADIDLLESIYIEPWWVEALAARDLRVIGHKMFDAHNYQLTGVEAYLDLYILTGKQRYLDAVMGAWAMHRDPVMGWIHVGGSLAINEGSLYVEGSYHLESGVSAEGGINAPPGRTRAHYREQREHAAAHHHAHHHEGGDVHDHALEAGAWGSHPTGELCGAVFWLKINQRLHRLQPENETFVMEMEREIFNEGLGHQGLNGTGIRYFSNLNGVKEDAGHIGTCCEGQGTRLYGALPEFLYSTLPNGRGVFIDIYAPSTFTTPIGSDGASVTVTVTTEWPYGSDVTVDVSPSEGGLSFDLALRMPSWVATPSIPVSLNGVPLATPGIPGSYLHIDNHAAGVYTFSLPMALTSHAYTGVTQLPPYKRFAVTYGPVLLAATGTWDKALKSLRVPGVDGSAPSSWMTLEGPLHWSVPAAPGVTFIPAWEIRDTTTLFSAFPCFD